MIMRYDGVLQPWCPTHKYPYLILQNSRICQHCDVKTSTVAPTFYYFFYHLLNLLHQSTKFHLQSMLGSFTKESP